MCRLWQRYDTRSKLGKRGGDCLQEAVAALFGLENPWPDVHDAIRS
jgi:hypothetical protein